MRDLIKSTFYYTLSNLLSFIVISLSAFILAKILGPEEYGGYSAYKLFVTFLVNIQFGILQGLQREIPFQVAKNKRKELKEILITSFSFNVLISLLSIIFIFISSFFSSPFFKQSFLITLPLIPFFFLREFYKYILRGFEKFKELSLINFFDSIFIFILAILSAVYWRGKGAIFGFALSGVFFFFIGYKISGVFYKEIRINKKILKNLFLVGFPIFFVGLLNFILNSIDKLFLLGIIGKKSYGIYAISVSLLNFLYQIPIAASIVILPFLTRKKAEERTFEKFLIKNEKVLIIMFIILSLSSISLFFAGKIIIEIFLKKYLLSIPVIKIFFSFSPLISFSFVFYSFLIAENKHSYIIPYHLILIPLNIILNSILIPKFLIKGAAYSLIISQLLFTFIVIIIARRFITFNLNKTLFSLILFESIHFILFNFIS